MLQSQQRISHRIMPAGSWVHESHQTAVETGNGRVYSLVAVELPDSNQAPRAILMLRRQLPSIDVLGGRPGIAAHASHLLGEHERHANGAAPLTPWPAQPYAQPGAQPGPQLSTAMMLRLHQLTRPMVVRATLGEEIELHVTNLLPQAPLNLKLVDDDYGIQVGQPGQAAVEPLAKGDTRTYRWRCGHAGIYPIFNEAAITASERRCLLGVLIVEP